MSNAYRLVQWNAHKKVYDLVLAGAVAAYVGAFVGIARSVLPPPAQVSSPVLVMRALGTCALLMLHVVLCIGPLARLDARFAPLLYNRRHFGVMLFLIALAHAAVAVLYYGGFGERPAVLAAVDGYRTFASLSGFPFEVLGFLALLTLFLMAATSHDFWLANLTPRVWKGLHMLVYAAYAMLVMHVALGALQSERSGVYPLLLGLGVCVVGGLHFVAGRREVRKDAGAPVAAGAGSTEPAWIDIGTVDEIAEHRAKVVCLRGRERIAVFRYDGKVSAVSNVCAHQGGPLGEGKIVDGCITCPWHGYQYVPGSGQSPPPYSERIPTYEVRVEGRRVLVNPRPLAPGTPVEPARFESEAADD